MIQPPLTRRLSEAHAVLDRFAASATVDTPRERRLGQVLTREALALADQGRRSEAIAILRRAVAILKPLGTATKRDDPARGWLSESIWELGRLLREEGSSKEADLLDAERRLLWKEAEPQELARFALQQVTRAALVGYGKTPISEPAQTVRKIDLDQAADNLRMAVSLGFRDLGMLRADPDSWLLLSRPDLEPLILDLEFPEEPFQP